jgi:basic membrane protein A
MSKKFSLIVAFIMIATLILTACTPAATATQAPAATDAPKATVAPKATETMAPEATVTLAPTNAEVKKTKICQVTDTGGIDDNSFNATAWKGVQDAITKLGVDGKYLESQEAADYEKNLNAFIEEGCDLIIPVGFFLADATKAAAEANPDINFSIVDYAYDPAIANVQGQVFDTDGAAFLAGYLAAGMTKTGKVGTFGGFPIPTVTIFMDGFARGVAYYNETNGTKVEVLGWDINDANKGLFSSSFDDQAKGKELGISLLDEGADIIMPVAGPVGFGTAAAVKERGNAWIIGVDSDWYLTGPAETKDVVLTSVLKNMDVTTLEAIQQIVDGTFKGGGMTVGTLANGGVGIAPFHDTDSLVSADLKAALDKVKADVLSGAVKTRP